MLLLESTWWNKRSCVSIVYDCLTWSNNGQASQFAKLVVESIIPWVTEKGWVMKELMLQWLNPILRSWQQQSVSNSIKWNCAIQLGNQRNFSSYSCHIVGINRKTWIPRTNQVSCILRSRSTLELHNRTMRTNPGTDEREVFDANIWHRCVGEHTLKIQGQFHSFWWRSCHTSRSICTRLGHKGTTFRTIGS